VNLCLSRKNSITALSDLPLSWPVDTLVDVLALPLPNLYLIEAEYIGIRGSSLKQVFSLDSFTYSSILLDHTVHCQQLFVY